MDHHRGTQAFGTYDVHTEHRHATSEALSGGGGGLPSLRLYPALARGAMDSHAKGRLPCYQHCTSDDDCPRYQWALTPHSTTADQAAEGAAGKE